MFLLSNIYELFTRAALTFHLRLRSGKSWYWSIRLLHTSYLCQPRLIECKCLLKLHTLHRLSLPPNQLIKGGESRGLQLCVKSSCCKRQPAQFSCAPLRRLIKNILQEKSNNARISARALDCIREALEAHLTNLFSNAMTMQLALSQKRTLGKNALCLAHRYIN